jgi:hypothetical protein
MKPIILFLLIICISSTYGNISAQSDVLKTKKFINRTNIILKKANVQVKKGKVFTGDLSKALKHQKHAYKLFKKGDFKLATYHSAKARRLATIAYLANGGKTKKDWEFGNEEKKELKETPRDKDLENQLDDKTPVKDQEAVEVNLEDL